MNIASVPSEAGPDLDGIEQGDFECRIAALLKITYEAILCLYNDQ